jgi:hypothetical protein
MRTKSLLLTAALVGAGIASSMAQAVYSVNAVGYVNLTLPRGFSMIANPLNNGSNALSQILPNVPDNTQLLKYDAAQQRFSSTVPSFVVGAGWFPDGTLRPGEGAFLNVDIPAGTTTTITFVGEVPQGNLTQPVPVGFSIQASQVPQTGRLTTDLLFPATDNDQVYQFNNATQSYNPNVPAYVDGAGWFPTEPTIAVGTSFFVAKTGARTWTRTFSVN